LIRVKGPEKTQISSEGVASVLHPGFVLTGVVSNLLGALLPVFAARWGLSDKLAGSMFLVQYAGVLTGNAVSHWLVRRIGLVRALGTGYLTMAAGVAGLGMGGWKPADAAIFTFGLALGLTMPPTNLLIAEINPGRSAAALNLLNTAWCLGGVICSPVVAIFSQANNLPVPQVALVGGLAAVGLYLLNSAGDPPENVQPEPQVPGRAGTIWRDPIALVIGSLIFLYVGAETAIGGWVAMFTKRATSASPATWALAQSAFWATLMGGRILAPALLKRVNPEKLVLAGLSLAGGGVTLLLARAGLIGHWCAIALAGGGLAIVFPTTIAIYSQIFGARASKSVGHVFALGGIGGASLPWLVGLASSQTGSLRFGLLVPLSAVILMIILQFRLLTLLRGVGPR
jgi:fucose permease